MHVRAAAVADVATAASSAALSKLPTVGNYTAEFFPALDGKPDWLLQVQHGLCGLLGPSCSWDTIHLVLLLGTLVSAILGILCAFCFIKDNQENLIMPLCPQLIVKSKEENFLIPAELPPKGAKANEIWVVDLAYHPKFKVTIDWPCNSQPVPMFPGGLTGQISLRSDCGVALATVSARTNGGLVLCRVLPQGSEVFGVMEPDGPDRYTLRHRTGLVLLTLQGEFAANQMEGISAAGAVVFRLGQAGAGRAVCGTVLQHVDMGLMLCCALAVQLHRRLQVDVAEEEP